MQARSAARRASTSQLPARKSRRTRARAQVFVEAGTPARQIARLTLLFASNGLDARIEKAPYGRVGAFEPFVTNLIVASLAGFFGAFGKDVYRATRAAAAKRLRLFLAAYRRARRVRAGAQLRITLRDQRSDVTVMIDADCPEDALSELFSIDYSRLRPGDVIRYDHYGRSWFLILREPLVPPIAGGAGGGRGGMTGSGGITVD